MDVLHTYTYCQAPKSLQCLRFTAFPNGTARHDPCPGTDLAKTFFPLEPLRSRRYQGFILNGIFLSNSPWDAGSHRSFC